MRMRVGVGVRMRMIVGVRMRVIRNYIPIDFQKYKIYKNKKMCASAQPHFTFEHVMNKIPDIIKNIIDIK